MPPRLDMLGIVKHFGGVRALDGADLSAQAGEILGVCGENGAGKSTLLKVLSGVYPHGSYRGEVRVDGTLVALRSTAEARRAGIGIVHQELMLVPEMSVAANLMLGREPMRFGLVDDLAIEASARALLAQFGVAGEIDAAQPVGELGIGRQQIVEIVRALSQDVRILVLDEPTAALTADECERLMAWLRELKTRGTTCLYVSHRMDEVFALTDRITVLRDGRTAGTVVTAETQPHQVISMMVGRELPKAAPRAAANPRGAPALELVSLRMGHVVNDVSLTVHDGEVVALAGAMGAGRTALLSTLFGCAEARVSGTIKIAGREQRLRSPADAIAAGLALVPEDRKGRGLVLSLSVAENLALVNPSLRRRRGSIAGAMHQSMAAFLDLFAPTDDLADEQAALARIDEMRLRGEARAEVATLSGGNQQKVVLGKWLRRPPRVLLLDEPTRGVDVGAREEIYALLAELNRRGTAILMASSDLQEVLRLAHRIVVLRHGRIAGELPGATATMEEIVNLSTGAGTLAPMGAGPLREAQGGLR